MLSQAQSTVVSCTRSRAVASCLLATQAAGTAESPLLKAFAISFGPASPHTEVTRRALMRFEVASLSWAQNVAPGAACARCSARQAAALCTIKWCARQAAQAEAAKWTRSRPLACAVWSADAGAICGFSCSCLLHTKAAQLWQPGACCTSLKEVASITGEAAGEHAAAPTVSGGDGDTIVAVVTGEQWLAVLHTSLAQDMRFGTGTRQSTRRPPRTVY